MALCASSITHRVTPIPALGPVTRSATCAAQRMQARLLQTLIDTVDSHAADSTADGAAIRTAKVRPGRIRANIHTAVNLLCDIRSRADDLAVDRCALHLHHPAGTGRTLVTAAAHLAIEHLFRLPADLIMVEIRADTIALTGAVSCSGDRLAAQVAISYLAGQLSIDNHVRVNGRSGQRRFVGRTNPGRIKRMAWSPTVRPFVGISHTNLTEATYVDTGHATRRIVDEYYEEFTRLKQ